MCQNCKILLTSASFNEVIDLQNFYIGILTTQDGQKRFHKVCFFWVFFIRSFIVHSLNVVSTSSLQEALSFTVFRDYAFINITDLFDQLLVGWFGLGTYQLLWII